MRAETVREEIERRLPDFDTPITINVNGCPNSCARFQVADIGFKGMVTRDADGNYQDSFQVHLGGQMGTEAEFGRKFRGLKVTAEEVPDYIERVLRGYLGRREGGEAFAAYVSRADEAWLL
jgi:sulfite reductase (ferredoxin)